MRTPQRTALTLAGLALVAGGLAGCGGSDSGGGSDGGMPTSASQEEFCANFQKLQDDLGNLDPSADPSEAVNTLHDAADSMEATGTPEGIPDDARRGLEVTLAAIQGLPDDATLDDISKLESTLSDTDKKDADAFDAYLEKECPDLG